MQRNVKCAAKKLDVKHIYFKSHLSPATPQVLRKICSCFTLGKLSFELKMKKMYIAYKTYCSKVALKWLKNAKKIPAPSTLT